MLCAGSSPAGMRFTAAEATHGFVGGPVPGERPTAGESLRWDAADLPPVWHGSRLTPRTPAMLADELHENDLDGMLLSAADWACDLDLVEHEVLPAVRSRGVTAPVLGRPGATRLTPRVPRSAV